MLKSVSRGSSWLPAWGSSIEEVLFAFVSNGYYGAACDLLEEIRQRIPQGGLANVEKEEDRGLELCLPLRVSLEGFRRWLQRIDALQPDPISVFLEHVVSTVPFYHELFAKQLRRSGVSLGDFPTVSRENIIQQYHHFLSTRFAEEPHKYFKATSGTTTRPLIVWFDLVSFYELSYVTYNTVARLKPDLDSSVRPGGLAAVQITDHPHTWRASTVLPALKFARLDRRVFDQTSTSVFRLVEELRNTPPPFLCGMPSSLLRFSSLDRTLPSDGDRIRPKAVFVSGENLFEDWRHRLEQWFECPVYSAYISSEGGLLAIECRNRNGLHVQESRVHLEIVDEIGKIHPYGSGEVVLTNYMNWAMPFVRYRTGDQATIDWVSCRCGFVGSNITDLYGREAPYFSASSRRVKARTLDPLLLKLSLRDFRVIQEAEGRFLVKWVPERPDCKDSCIELAVTRILRSVFGGVEVKVQRLEQLTAPGQKASRYIRMAPTGTQHPT